MISQDSECYEADLLKILDQFVMPIEFNIYIYIYYESVGRQ